MTLAGIALLMFFLPLLVIHAPIIGEQDVSGYDVFSKVREFSKQVEKHPGESEKPQHPDNRKQAPASSEPTPPLSLRLAWLIPVSITLAFIFSAVVTAGTHMKKPMARTAAYLGTVFSLAAILHITIANSDFHAWTAMSMKSSTSELADNPFAAIADQFGSMMANAFKITPGVGLYILAACLGLIAVIAKTRVFMKLRLVESEASKAASGGIEFSARPHQNPTSADSLATLQIARRQA